MLTYEDFTKIDEGVRKTYKVMVDGHNIATIKSSRDIKYCIVTYWEKLGMRNKPFIHGRTDSRQSAQRKLVMSKQNYKDQRDVPRYTKELGHRISVIAELIPL